MSFIAAVYKMCLDKNRKAIQEEREFELKLAAQPKTVNINLTIKNVNSDKLINPIVID